MPKQIFGKLLTVGLLLAECLANAASADGKVQVFILAGQSNMQGMANVSTFPYIGEDPETAELYADMVNPDGSPRVVENTWITYYQADEADAPQGEAFGPLSAGYGSRRIPTASGDKIGPEYTFGIYMQKLLDAPILIIKTAWGGKSLFQDFRPPSAGSFPLSDADAQRILASGGDVEAERQQRRAASGHYYRLMMAHIAHVLDDVGRVCPTYDANQGYDLAGFVWFQGWNDMVNSRVYPDRGKPGGYDAYSALLATFIRDVRRDLDAPDLPFVIGVMGVEGPLDNLAERYRPIHGSFREAMAAPASRESNVTAVQTAPFWDMRLDALVKKRNRYNDGVRSLKTQLERGELDAPSFETRMAALQAEALTATEEESLERGASNAAYHYLGCAKTMGLIGRAFAEAAFALQQN